MKNLKYLVIGLFAFAIVGVSNVFATDATDVQYEGSNVTSEKQDDGSYLVTLTGNADEDFQVLDGQTVVLDLNGFELTNYTLGCEAIKVFEGGKLTIVDNSETQTGKVIHKEGSTYGIITNQGTLVIEGGNYEISDNFYIIRNEADMTINGGKFSSTSKTSMIGNMRSTNPSGEELTDNDVYPKLVIKGGEFTSEDTVLINYANSTMEINGGTFTSANEYALDNSGAVTIKTGTLTSESTSAIFLNKDASKETVALSISIAGGTITSAEDVESDFVLYANGTTGSASSDIVTITGGTFSNDVTNLLGESYEVVTDENGNVTVQEKEDVVLPPVEETPSGDLGDSNTPTEDTTTPSEDVPEVPQTFDALGIYAGIGLVSIAAIAGAVIYLKRRA